MPATGFRVAAPEAGRAIVVAPSAQGLETLARLSGGGGDLADLLGRLARPSGCAYVDGVGR